MMVHVIGPNLPDQSKGQFHVHAEGCPDVRRSRDYRSREFEYDRTTAIEAHTVEDVVSYAYADQLDQGEATAADGVDDFHIFPCAAGLLTLPGVTA